MGEREREKTRPSEEIGRASGTMILKQLAEKIIHSLPNTSVNIIEEKQRPQKAQTKKN